ncbi:MAG: lasso RiPP family leader peptide-containing protein [bacterium]|jgi:hypothetical protein|nr:MAG: hypothetical protein DIU52_05160 [bacterium]
MYVKPRLERFGSVRELTQYGLSTDCDGGIFGVDAARGHWVGCTNTGNRS